MREVEVMDKCLEIVNQLDGIIWWCGTVHIPIYNVDENGERHPRSLHEIRKDFAQKYNEISDMLEKKGI